MANFSISWRVEIGCLMQIQHAGETGRPVQMGQKKGRQSATCIVIPEMITWWRYWYNPA